MCSRAYLAAIFAVVGLSLACGGGGGGRRGADGDEPAPAAVAPPPPPAVEHQYGSVAFKTYSGNIGSFEFSSETKCLYWWPNSAIDAPHCHYTHVGDDIVITFDAPNPDYDGKTMKLRQIDGCALAQTYYEAKDGTNSDDTYMYEQKKPKCKL